MTMGCQLIKCISRARRVDKLHSYVLRYDVVSYEFLWTRRTCDYILSNAYYCALFSSRVRIRCSGWLVSYYAHVFIPFAIDIVP